MLLLNLLIDSAPIMSEEQIYRAANESFGTSFKSFEEMDKENPVVFSALAQEMSDPQKIAYLNILGANRGCVECQAYLAALLKRPLEAPQTSALTHCLRQ